MAHSSTEQKDDRFYVQGGGKEIAIILKEKGMWAYFDICVDLARHRRRSTVGWGFEGFDGFIANHWYVR
jgi:hypothetical protein